MRAEKALLVIVWGGGLAFLFLAEISALEWVIEGRWPGWDTVVGWLFVAGVAVFGLWGAHRAGVRVVVDPRRDEETDGSVRRPPR